MILERVRETRKVYGVTSIIRLVQTLVSFLCGIMPLERIEEDFMLSSVVYIIYIAVDVVAS